MKSDHGSAKGAASATNQNARTPNITRKKYGEFLLDRILGWILDTVVGMVLTALGLTSVLQAVLLRIYGALGTNIELVAISSAVIFTGTLILLLVLRQGRPNLPPPPGDYKIETLKIEMEYLTRESVLYSRSFRLRALVDDFDHFRDSFHWTGGDVVSIQSSNPFHSVSITDEAGFYTQYEVAFNETFERGDRVDFTISWELKDDGRVARPFVARQITRPQSELSFFIKLYPGSHSKSAIGQVAVSQSDRANANQKAIPFKGDVVSWNIRRPYLGYYYELRWSGPDWH